MFVSLMQKQKRGFTKMKKGLLLLIPTLTLLLGACNAKKEDEEVKSQVPTLKGVEEAKAYFTNNPYEILNQVTAYDEQDGDLTKNIEYSVLPFSEILQGDIFVPKTAGTYYIYYKVSDSDGNVAKAMTTLSVYNKPSEVPEVLPKFVRSDKKAQVILMIGQSNMEGWSHSKYVKENLGEEAYNTYNNGAPNVKIAFCKTNSRGTFGNVRFGLGVESDRFGPEVAIAQKLKENSDEDYYLVKYAVGGTNLAEQWAAPSGGFTGVHYQGTVDYLNLALLNLIQEGIDFEIPAIVWMQGNSDCGNSTWVNYYYRNEKRLVADLRKLLNGMSVDRGIEFIDTLVTDLGSGSATGDNLLIDEAKIRNMNEDELGMIVDTRDCGLVKTREPVENPDTPHYDSTSEIRLGEMMGDALLTTLSLR